MPPYWDELCSDIKNNIPNDEDLPIPLFLAVWEIATDNEKRERLTTP